MHSCGYTLLNNAMFAWYPTEAPETLFKYRPWFTGSVAVNAKAIDGPLPTVLFSHGALSLAHQSLFITEGLARRGWLVLACDHKDKSVPNFLAPAEWTVETCFYRRVNLVNLFLGATSQFNIDVQRFGIIGHSLGGYDALAMAGGIPEWDYGNLKFAIGLSPYNWPIYYLGGFEQIAIPVQLQGGIIDLGITPTLPFVLDRLSGVKELVMIDNAGHFAWTNTTCLFIGTEQCLAQQPKAQQPKAQQILEHIVRFTEKIA